MRNPNESPLRVASREGKLPLALSLLFFSSSCLMPDNAQVYADWRGSLERIAPHVERTSDAGRQVEIEIARVEAKQEEAGSKSAGFKNIVGQIAGAAQGVISPVSGLNPGLSWVEWALGAAATALGGGGLAYRNRAKKKESEAIQWKEENEIYSAAVESTEKTDPEAAEKLKMQLKKHQEASKSDPTWKRRHGKT